MKLDAILVETYQRIIKEHRDIANTYQLALDDLIKRFNGENAEPNPKTPVSTQQPLFDNLKVVQSKSPTFNTNIVDLLKKEDEPMTASVIREMYNTEYGTNYDKGGFSPKLSFALLKYIKKYVIPSNPLETRNYYGLPEWFDGDELKPNYKEKIKADRFGSQLL